MDVETPELGQELIDLGAVDVAATSYINYLQLLTGTAGVSSTAIVFLSEDGAIGYMDLLQQVFEEDPDYTAFSAPPIGNASFAYVGNVTNSGIVFTVYQIGLRRNNIAASIATLALPDVAAPDDAIQFGQFLARKICNQ